MVAQLAQTANGFVDAVMAGQASALDLAAVSIGSSIWVPVYLLVNGILVSITPTVAQHFGANRNPQAGHAGNQGLWLALALSLLGVFLLRNAGYVFPLMGLDADLSQLTARYLKAFSWGFIAITLFMVVRAFSEGLSITKPIMVISFIGLLCNIPLNWIFIFGKFGVPALGGEGCGVATALVMVIMCLLLTAYVTLHKQYRSYKFSIIPGKPDFKVIQHLLAIGLPIGVSIFIEVSIFAVIALLIGNLGTHVVSGHQIALNFASMLFMLPLSVGLALTIAVGQAMGKSDFQLVRDFVRAGLILTAVVATANCLVTYFLRYHIPKIYNDNVIVTNLASELLLYAIIFQFSDALQVAAQGALRGLKETRGPMLITLVSYWLIALPVGVILGQSHWLGTPMGPHGFWLGLACGLTVAAILLNFQLIKKINRVR